MKEKAFKISGQIVDVVIREIFPGTIHIEDGKIRAITRDAFAPKQFILPGLVDAHVHIESSMVIPSEFARMAVVHGTVATVSDPHEIANVMGVRGVDFMIANSSKVPFYFNYGAPSCVPATAFETAGAVIGPDEVDELLRRPEIKYLSEMMNYPGVINGDADVLQKIASAKKYNKPVDGHAPGLHGEEMRKYMAGGISTDHECFTAEEALEKVAIGTKIIIREGSAAKNFDALIGLLNSHPELIMFCSDDKHPDALAAGHINLLLARAVNLGFSPVDVIRAATFNPVQHYNLDNGLLQVGDNADFIIIGNMRDFEVRQTYIRGIKVADHGKSLIDPKSSIPINHFKALHLQERDLVLPCKSNLIRVIEALDGQLITNEMVLEAKNVNGLAVSDPERDILKMVVVNRYTEAPVAFAFVKNFGLKNGAIASSVAHDSHNIIAVGTDDKHLADAINLLIENKGGISIASENFRQVQGLSVAGLMSNDDGYQVASAYEKMDAAAKAIGSGLAAPYMTLSFLALLVIRRLKLSDKGLFDGHDFKFTPLFL